MERTKFPPRGITYQKEQEPIVLSKALLDALLSHKNYTNLIALYSFYYYTAKWQKTSQPKATTQYTAKGVGWSEEKVRRVKSQLKKMNLIEDITARDASNKITGHYIKINFIWEATLRVFPHCGFSHTVENLGANALNIKSIINTLKTNNKITSLQFEKFWKIYPKKADKGKALTAWEKICRKPLNKRPTWKTINIAISRQKRTPRWQDGYIPHPSTWLNQSRWLDDPKEMKSSYIKHDDSPAYYIRFGMRWERNKNDEYVNEDGEILEREEYINRNGKLMLE